MLHEEESPMDLVPPGQPEDENAHPPDGDQIDPAQAERERLQAKVNSYIEAVFGQNGWVTSHRQGEHSGRPHSTYSRHHYEAPGRR